MAKRRFRRLVPLLVALLAGLLGVAPLTPAVAAPDYPFRDPRLPLATRVNDLLQRLTLDEKVSLLHQYQPAIPRLGIASFKTGTEALHGVAWSTDVTNGGAVVTAKGTVFPQAVGLASTWDPALLRRVGAVVGTEARGYHAQAPYLWGLNLWAPVVNLLRDPRWGRNEEGYSEDPYLTGVMSTAYGTGITGGDPDHLRAAPTLKHYLANNNEVRRDQTSSVLRPRVEWEYDQAAFKPAITANAATGVMSSYNLINGRPATVNPDLDQVVRSWTKKSLLNVTDAGAPNGLVNSQQYYPNTTEGNAASLKAGIDSFTVDDTNGAPTRASILAALSAGLITESDVDDAVRHILDLRFRLGEFDPGGGRYGNITPDVIDSPAHRKVARESADKSVVLLKNSGKALPLSPTATKKVAVVGPLSDTLYTDWYSGALPYEVTPLDGVRERLGTNGTVSTSEGVDRIALRELGTRRYVVGGSAAAGADLAATGTSAAEAAAQFDVFDWGQGIVTLRSAANGKVVGRYNWGPTFRNDQAQPNGWFVQQQFAIEDAGDGAVVLRYAGYEKAYDWAGPEKYLTVAADGTLSLTATTAAAATRFAKETVTSGVDSAVAAVKGADAAVVVVGSMPFINGREDHDRTTMDLAAGQEALVRAVRAANPKTIVVLENSYPTTINWEQANVPAILWTTHAGAETGHAVADVLFGDHNPSARLPQTWYRSMADLPDILDYDIISSDRTYQYFRGTPLYPFGYGLSYTSFGYRNLRLSTPVAGAGDVVKVSVDVTNTGARAGDEVMQLYTHQRASRDKQPLRTLAGFGRVHLRPGETRTVTVSLPVSKLAHWDVTRSKWTVEKGVRDILVGPSSADVRARGTLAVRGETIPARNLARPTRGVDFDDYAGVTLVDYSKADGDALGVPASGGWASFRDVDLGRGARTFTARTAREAAGTGTIEVRLDSPTGRLVGTATVASTGDRYTYATTTAPLTGATGRHDVYLVFTGEQRLATFTLR